MRILKANLCYRFSPHDGWTRKMVSELFKEPDFSKVIPRYYDLEMDQHIMDNLKKNYVMPENLNDGEYQDCEYFAVYDSSMKIEKTKISMHEIIFPSY